MIHCSWPRKDEVREARKSMGLTLVTENVHNSGAFSWLVLLYRSQHWGPHDVINVELCHPMVKLQIVERNKSISHAAKTRYVDQQ